MDDLQEFEVKEEEFDSFMQEMSLNELFTIDESGTILLKCSRRAIGYIDIPYGIEVIEDEAFLDCSGIMSIKVPWGVKKIGKQAFAYCSALSSVDLPETIEEIGEEAFLFCEQLCSINLPEGLKTLSEGCFIGTAFEHLELPDSIEKIEDGVFAGCTELFSIKMPSNLKVLQNAFEDCTHLKSIELPSNLRFIGSTFIGCENLNEIEVHNIRIKPIIDKFDYFMNLYSEADQEQGFSSYERYVDQLWEKERDKVDERCEDKPFCGINEECALLINERDAVHLTENPLLSHFSNVKFLDK